MNIADPVNPPARPYHAPQRAAAAARTREAIVAAAKDVFERLGWSGATMRAVADQAGVSVKTVEALYRLHAHHTRSIGSRAAPIFWVVEQAASAHPDIAALWAQMSGNRRTGAQWAAATLLAKPGVPPHIGQRYAEEVFWIAIDPGTYRSLTLGRGLSPDDFEAWVGNFYTRMLLHEPGPAQAATQ